MAQKLKMKYSTFQGHRIAYTSKGKGAPVVLLHGFCSDSRMWEDFKADLLEEKYRVIAIDLPGFGQSDVIESVSISDMAAAVATVLDALKLEQAFLIGHSMGGYTALAFAEQWPERLLGLGMFHSHPAADDSDKRALRQKSMDFIRRHGAALYVKQLIPGFFAPTFVKSNAFLVEKLSFRASRYAPAGIVAALEAMKNRPDRSEVLRSIPCPVLFIIGKLDTAIPYDATIEQTSLPTVSSVHILDKVAHMGMFEATRQTQTILRQFLSFCLERQTLTTTAS